MNEKEIKQMKSTYRCNRALNVGAAVLDVIASVWCNKRKKQLFCLILLYLILGDPAAASRDDGIFMGESLQQERESPWALTLTERVSEAFEIPPSDWPEKYFSGQSAKRNSRATLMSSYTRLFSSSNAVVAWPVQREHF